MDSRKDMTKRLIADGFKALMLRYPFELTNSSIIFFFSSNSSCTIIVFFPFSVRKLWTAGTNL